jgi:hypothetical protein
MVIIAFPNLGILFSLGNQFSLVEQTVFVATFMQHFRTKSVDSFAPPDGSNPILNQVAKLSVFIEKIYN